MKPKQIVILCVILGILAAAVLVRHLLRAASDASSAQGSALVIAAFDPEKTERIVIAHGVKAPTVELLKEAGVWKVQSLWNSRADSMKVGELLRKISALHGELRASGKKLFPDFGIDEAQAFSLRCFGPGNTALLDLRVGVTQAGPDGYFVRQGSGEDIFLVNLDMPAVLGVPAGLEDGMPLSDVWADLGLFNFDPEKVTKITLYQIKGDAKNMALGLVLETDPQDPLKSSWKFLRKEMTSTLDPEKVLKYVATLLSIKAQKVVAPGATEYGLEKPSWQLAVTEGNKKVLLNVGAEAAKEGLYYVKLSSDPSIFALSGGYFNDLNKDDTHFVMDAAQPAKAPQKS